MDSTGDCSDKIVGIISVFDGEVPYIRRSPVAKLYPGKWCIPSGHIKNGETPEQAAVRELSEEIGYKMPAGEAMRKADNFTYTVDMGKDSLKLDITLFIHTSKEKPALYLCDEHTEYRYVSIDILSDKEKLFLYSHAHGIGMQDFTPIDLRIIRDYMPMVKAEYEKSEKSIAKSIA